MDDVGLPINGIMGTSAGALIGSLYAAGYTPREVRRSTHLPRGPLSASLLWAPAAGPADTAALCLQGCLSTLWVYLWYLKFICYAPLRLPWAELPGASCCPRRLPSRSLATQIVAEFAKHAPIERLACNHRFWEGLLSMEPLIKDLQALLPPSFSQLHQGACCWAALPRWRHRRCSKSACRPARCWPCCRRAHMLPAAAAGVCLLSVAACLGTWRQPSSASCRACLQTLHAAS